MGGQYAGKIYAPTSLYLSFSVTTSSSRRWSSCAYFYAVAWVLDRIVIASIKRLVQRTRAEFDDQLIQLLHGPIYKTVMLVGCAVATLILDLPERAEQIVFSVLITVALLIWSVVVFKLVRITLRRISRDPRRAQMLNLQTLPLFENIAIVLLVGISVYYIFSAWNVDMTAWLASAGIVGIAVGFRC